jgi:hypothetical protein
LYKITVKVVFFTGITVRLSFKPQSAHRSQRFIYEVREYIFLFKKKVNKLRTGLLSTAVVGTKAYDTGLYSLLLPEGWKAEDFADNLNFTRSGDAVDSLFIITQTRTIPFHSFRAITGQVRFFMTTVKYHCNNCDSGYEVIFLGGTEFKAKVIDTRFAVKNSV